jgi:hypothetical protein
MNKLWDFECSECHHRVEGWVPDAQLAMPCPCCNGSMLRIMGGKPSKTANDTGPKPSSGDGFYLTDPLGGTWHSHPLLERNVGHRKETLGFLHPVQPPPKGDA